MNAGKYKVVLIEEGLGNLGSLFYYTRQALQYAADNKVFEGAQCYEDHPSMLEEQIQPERKTSEILGYFENVHVEDGEQGQAMLVGDFTTIPGEDYDWARSLIDTALDVSGKFDSELVGFSINASGNSEKKSIDDLLADETLPISVKPKLQLAKSQGNDEVEYCTMLMEAVSCDLVTKAGARGRALKKLVESERTKRMSTKKPAKENKQATPPPADPTSAPAHDDQDQDKELIQSMLTKYLGDGDHPQEVHEAMKQAYEHAKEMGMEGEEAQNCAGYSMKMAKHAAEKKEAEESAGADAPTPAAAPPAAPAPKGKMESEVVALKGQVAGLMAKVRENEIKECLAKTIKESGFEGAIAKKFKEAVGTPKSEDEIKEKAKLFKEALVLASGTTNFFNPEKTTNQGESGFSLADCVKE